MLGMPTEDDVRALYRIFFERDPENRDAIAAHLQSGLSIVELAKNFLESEEFYFRVLGNQADRGALVDFIRLDPAIHYDEKCIVFLHIPKSAGTTLAALLKEMFSDLRACPEGYNNLHAWSPAALSQFSFFSGHFDYEALRYIPKRSLTLLTMFREPKARLVSLYHFLRAHDPDANPAVFRLNKLAWELPIEEYFEHPEVVSDATVANSMCHILFGAANLDRWERSSEVLRPLQAAFRQAPDAAMEVILHRLRKFEFVGIVEDFERSLRLLGRVFSRPVPETAFQTRHHALDELMDSHGAFRRIERQPVTPRVDAALERLTVFDRVLYAQARLLFEQRCAAAGILPPGYESFAEPERLTASLASNDLDLREGEDHAAAAGQELGLALHDAVLEMPR